MTIFSEPPKSFKLDRKSLAASKLKKFVSDKLTRIFPDYADDVLAEYITVLVCNGKNQNQAREDLEAFLGENTVDFVSWLWSLLLKYEHQSVRASSEQKGEEEKFFHHSSNGASNRASMVKSEDVKTNRVMSEACVSESPSQIVRGNFTTGGEETQIAKLSEKIKSSHCSGYLHVELQRKEPVSVILSASQSETPYVTQGTAGVTDRNVRLTTLTSSPHKSNRRCSVWDRLGKPSLIEPLRGRTNEVHGYSVVQHNEEQVNRLLSLPTSTDLQGSTEISNHFSGKIQGVEGPMQVSHLDGPESGSLATNNIRSKRPFTEVHVVRSESMDGRYENVSRADKRSASVVKSSQAIVSQVNDMKVRIRQIESEVSKLRSKQVEREKGRKSLLLSDASQVKPTDDDIESRTILVTNVHFGATKEALSLYFGKCGEVMDVTHGSSFSASSVYITFASKESAEKALSLSGTCFYSRPIMVTRKREATTGSLPAKLVGTQSQGEVSHVKKNPVHDPPYQSTKLQWRRVSVTSTVPEPSASDNNITGAATTTASQQQPSVLPISQDDENLRRLRPGEVKSTGVSAGKTLRL